MNAYPTLRRWLSAGVTAAVFGILVTLGVISGRSVEDKQPGKDPAGGKMATHPWPLFGGHVNRNMVNTVDRNVPTTWSTAKGKEKNILWAADLGSKAYGGPVIADGKIFVGTNNERPRDKRFTDAKGKGIDMGILMCFEEATGKFLWQHAYKKLEAGRVVDWPLEGICSTPIIEGDRLYYVSNRCQLVCANAADGKEVWNLDMIKELGVFPHNLAVCSPLIVGDLVFTVTANGVDQGHINIPAPQAPSFIAVTKKDGKVAWKDNSPSANLLKLAGGGNKEAFIKQLVDEGKLLMHGQWSNPVYAAPGGVPQIIFPGGDGWLRAFAAGTGKLIWEFDCNPKESFYKLGPRGTRNDFLATPVVFEDKVYIGVGQDPEHDTGVGHFFCIDATKKGDVSPGTRQVKGKTVSVFDPAAPENKNSALVWHYGGTEEQKIPGRPYCFGRTLSTAAVHDGLVYIADLDGFVQCLDAKTGKRQWFQDTQAQVWSSPYYVDGKVYIGDDTGTMWIFAAGKNLKVVSQVQMEGALRATPVVANGVLYVQTENQLFAIRNK